MTRVDPELVRQVIEQKQEQAQEQAQTQAKSQARDAVFTVVLTFDEQGLDRGAAGADADVRTASFDERVGCVRQIIRLALTAAQQAGQIGDCDFRVTDCSMLDKS